MRRLLVVLVLVLAPTALGSDERDLHIPGTAAYVEDDQERMVHVPPMFNILHSGKAYVGTLAAAPAARRIWVVN